MHFDVEGWHCDVDPEHIIHTWDL